MNEQFGPQRYGNAPAAANDYRPDWVRGHVRVGDTYPLISVRSSIRQAAGRAEDDPDSQHAVQVASFAIALAQALVEAGHRLKALEVDAGPGSNGGPDGAVELRVAGDAPDLDEPALQRITRQVLAQRVARGALRLDAATLIHTRLLTAPPANRTERGPSGVLLGRSQPSQRPKAAPRPPGLVVPSPPAPRVQEPPVPRPRPRLARPAWAVRPAWRRPGWRVPAPWLSLGPLVNRLGHSTARVAQVRVSGRVVGSVLALGGLAAVAGWAALAWDGAVPNLAPPKPAAEIRLTVVPTRAPVVAGAPTASRAGTPGPTSQPVAPTAAGVAAADGGATAAVATAPPALATAATVVAVAAPGNVAVLTAGPTAGPALPTPLLVEPTPTTAVATVAPALTASVATLAPTVAVVPTTAPAPTVSPTTATVAALAAATQPAAPAAVPPAPTAPTAPTAEVSGTSQPGALDAAAQRPLVEFAAGAAATPRWPSNPDSTAWLAPDGYHLAARQPRQFVAVGVLTAGCPRDVQVTATFQKTGGPPGGGYGVILRDQGPTARDGLAQGGKYYVVEVGDLGQVGIWRRDETDWIDLLPWQTTAAVQPGSAPNTLAVRMVGGAISLVVNGSEVATRTDDALADGCVGVFLGGDQNQALLSRLVVQSTR